MKFNHPRSVAAGGAALFASAALAVALVPGSAVATGDFRLTTPRACPRTATSRCR
jgi:hypothetical protein